MREIKFRGRRVDTEEWVYGYYFKATAAQLGEDVPLATARICHCIVSDGVKFYAIPESVGEFTGLRDKNGVEIYEGDIVEFNNETYESNEGGSEWFHYRDTGIIVWDVDGARFMIKDCEGDFVEEWFEDPELIVKGNMCGKMRS